MSDLLVRSAPRFAPLVAKAHSRRRRFVRRVARRFVQRLACMPASAWRTIMEHRTRRRLFSELQDLYDAILADIGIYRSDIASTVNELLRRRRIANDTALAVHTGTLHLSDLAWKRVPRPAEPVTRWPRNDNLAGIIVGPHRSSRR